MTDARRIAVFFYGHFMDEDLLRAKRIAPEKRRLAWVENFRLSIGDRATLVPSAGGTVHGVLFMLTHGEVDALYADASVAAYRPEAVLAHFSDGGAMPALCFNLSVPPAAGARNPEYAAKLRALAERVGLPRDYVASLA